MRNPMVAKDEGWIAVVGNQSGIVGHRKLPRGGLAVGGIDRIAGWVVTVKFPKMNIRRGWVRLGGWNCCYLCGG